MRTFRSNGKLLLTGEYLVLDGAQALAIPTKFGQSLNIEHLDEPKLIWKSLDHDNQLWFEETFTPQHIKNSFSSDKDAITKRLLDLLISAKQLNKDFLTDSKGYEITTQLDFPRNWGLGSSSTLINNIAQWAHVDAYELLDMTFGGSGYDIACAQYDKPLIYQLTEDSRHVVEVAFCPSFSEHLYFVHLNEKQNSRSAIDYYHTHNKFSTDMISEVNKLTQAILQCNEMVEFGVLIDKHEQLLSQILNLQPIKLKQFTDFEGSIKSLGAWGGDFVLVASKQNPRPYFEAKGNLTIIPYKEMIK